MHTSSPARRTRTTLAAALAAALLLPASAASANDDIQAEPLSMISTENVPAELANTETPAVAADETEVAPTSEAPEPEEPAFDGAQADQPAGESPSATDSANPIEPARLPAEELQLETVPVTDEAETAADGRPELHAPEAAFAAMLPQRTVTGTAIDANGLPLPGAQVEIHTGAGTQIVAAGGGGAFTVADVPVGNFSYNVTYPGRASATGSGTVTLQSTPRLDVVLSVLSSVSGRVVDINGQGIADVLVEVTLSAGSGKSTRTVADGSYALDGIEPGTGTVKFSGAAGSVFATSWWSNAGGSSAATPLAFPKTGTAHTGIDAQLRAAAIAVGYVLYPNDDPAVDAFVTVYDSEGSIVSERFTDATGRFATAGLPAGDYTVFATRWDPVLLVEQASEVQSFTMSGQPFNLQPLVLDRETEPEAVPKFVAVNDAFATPKDTLLQVGAPGVLANDDLGSLTESAPEEAAVAVEGLVSAVSHGEVQLMNDGSFVYQPDNGFVGTDTFTYKLYDLNDTVVLDPNTPKLTATVTITVGGSNGSDGSNGGNGSSDGTGSDADRQQNTSANNSPQAGAQSLAQTGSDSGAMLWVAGITAFLLLDGLVLLLIMRHRRRTATRALAGLDIADDGDLDFAFSTESNPKTDEGDER